MRRAARRGHGDTAIEFDYKKAYTAEYYLASNRQRPEADAMLFMDNVGGDFEFG